MLLTRCVDVSLKAVCFYFSAPQSNAVGISSLIFSSDVRQAKELRGPSLRFVKYVTHAMRRCFLEGCLFLFLGSSVQRCGDSILDIFKQCQRTWAKELRPSLRLNTLWNLDRSLNKRQAPSAQTVNERQRHQKPNMTSAMQKNVQTQRNWALNQTVESADRCFLPR